MKKSTIIWVIVVLAVIAVIFLMSKSGRAPEQSDLTVNQSLSDSPEASLSPSSVSNPAPSSSPAPLSVILNTANSSDLGTYLTAANGMTLYIYTNDTKGVSNCSGQCAVNWPPYTASSSALLKVGPTIGGKVSTITRSDGSKQVAYNGMPLYFWHKDAKPGDTAGQNVGGVWFVLKP